MKKDFIWNTIGTSLNAFTSLFYIIIVTRLNGVDTAGIFTFAFSISIIIQVLGYYAGRVFQVTENDKKISDSDYLYQHIITSIVMIIIAILYCVFKGYDAFKNTAIILLVLFRAIESTVDSVYAILQKNNILYKVGISYTLKATLSVLLFLIVDILFKNVLLSISMIIFVQLIILLFYDYTNIKMIKFRLNKFNKDNVLLIFKNGFMIFLVTLLIQYLNNAPKFPIDKMLSNSDQTIFGIIAMPATLVTLMAQFIIHPVINSLKNDFEKQDIKSFNKRVVIMLASIIALGLIVIIGGYLFAVPVFKFIYNLDLSSYIIDLIIILVGAIMCAMISIISNALITIRKTKWQAYSYIITSIITAFMSYYFVSTYMIRGACLTYLLSMSILLCLYITYYIICIKSISKKER